MIISTFNVNSIKARLPNVLAWIKARKPDVVLFQEIKCVDENFPALEFEDLGYNVATHGQKTYNGVAILSRHRVEDVVRGIPGMKDDQSRYIEAFTGGVRVASVYVPNGNPAPGGKFDYKLDWYDGLIRHARKLLEHEEPLALAGDFNVIPRPEDVYEPDNWRDDALFRIEAREKLRALTYLGFTDAVTAVNPAGHQYTFWDYQAGAWAKDNGLRIDHILLSPQAADKLKNCQIDKQVRAEEKASDHVPVWCELSI